MSKRGVARGVGLLLLFVGVFAVLTGLVDGFSGARGSALVLAGAGLLLVVLGGWVLGSQSPDLDEDVTTMCAECGRHRDPGDRFCAACGTAFS